MKRFLVLALSLLCLAAGMAEAKPHSSISLNTATTRQLRTLPGIGELLAQRIIAKRPFKTILDLKKVKGISEQRYQGLKVLVVL